MKATIKTTRYALLRRLSIVGMAAERKTRVWLTQCFLFERKGEHLLGVSGSNLEGEVSATVDCLEIAGDSSFRFFAEVGLLLKGLRNLPEQVITVDVCEGKMKVFYQQGRFELPVYTEGSFPDLELNEVGVSEVVLPSQLLIDGVGDVQGFLSSDELRPILGCAYMELVGKRLTMVGTDGCLLSMRELPIEREGEDVSFLLPARGVQWMLGAEGIMGEEVRMRRDSKSVELVSGDLRIVHRVPMGRYPNFRGVIPQGSSFSAKFSRMDMLNALRRMSPLAVDTGVVAVRTDNAFQPGALLLWVRNADFKCSGSETIGAEYVEISPRAAFDFKTGFNIGGLLRVVESMKEDGVVMHFSTPTMACVVKPEGREDRLLVLMPVMAG